MNVELLTYLQQVTKCGGSVAELGAAERICRAGWSASLDRELLLEGVNFAKMGDMLFDHISEAFAVERKSVEKCRLLCLMYEEMTEVGMAWSSRKDAAFVNAFLANADGWQREACRVDGVMRALLCRAAAYYLYCQESDTNPVVSKFVDVCVLNWKSAAWGDLDATLALERIAAMRSVAQMEADTELLKIADGRLDAVAEILLKKKDCTIELLADLHDLLAASGKFDKLRKLDCVIEEIVDRREGTVADSFLLESLLFASRCVHTDSLSAV